MGFVWIYFSLNTYKEESKVKWYNYFYKLKLTYVQIKNKHLDKLMRTFTYRFINKLILTYDFIVSYFNLSKMLMENVAKRYIL